MILYKILVRHYAPKDSHESVQGFFAAHSEEEVAKFVLTKLGYHSMNELCREKVKIYDDDYNVIGRETRLDRLTRLGGDYFDEDADCSDAYYGVTHYGWAEVGEATDERVAVLKECGVFLDPPTYTGDEEDYDPDSDSEDENEEEDEDDD